MHYHLTTAFTLLSLSCNVQAWGTVGHATVATIANNYLTPAAQTYVSNILGAGVSMASVASWADDYRRTTAGRFSASYQYAPSSPLHSPNPPSYS